MGKRRRRNSSPASNSVGKHCARKGSTLKRLVVFDLDGTLAESKSALGPEMALFFDALLRIVKVAVISGGGWPQFEQ
jgi:hypothetical protein